MFYQLDQVLETILNNAWLAPPSPPNIDFGVPDERWHTKIMSETGQWLNIYLYEIQENRQFRRSHWDVIEQPNRTATAVAPPVYYDCHYLISAWSTASADHNPGSLQDSPVRDEHETLGEALRILLRHPDVVPAQLEGVALANSSPVFQQAHIYLSVTPPEPARVLNEFWNTMKQPWRPAIQLIVTAPIDLRQEKDGSDLVTVLIHSRLVTSGKLSDRQNGNQHLEERIQIGGWVLAADESPIKMAVVQRITADGAVLEEVSTDVNGRFTIVGLTHGTHRLRIGAPGKRTAIQDINVPETADKLPEAYIFRLSP